MRWTTISAAAVVLGSVNALSFPRSKAGKGYLSMHVGTVERSKNKHSKRQNEDEAIAVRLENKDFFYATDSASLPITSSSSYLMKIVLTALNS